MGRSVRKALCIVKSSISVRPNKLSKVSLSKSPNCQCGAKRRTVKLGVVYEKNVAFREKNGPDANASPCITTCIPLGRVPPGPHVGPDPLQRATAMQQYNTLHLRHILIALLCLYWMQAGIVDYSK